MQENTYYQMQATFQPNSDVNYISLLKEFRELLKNFRNDQLHDYSPPEHHRKLMQDINSFLTKCPIDKSFICSFIEYHKLPSIDATVAGYSLSLLKVFILCAKADLVELLLNMGADTSYNENGQSPLNPLLDNSQLNMEDKTTYDNIKQIIQLFQKKDFNFSKVVNRIEKTRKRDLERIPNLADQYISTYNVLEYCQPNLSEGLQKILSELDIKLDRGYKEEYRYDSKNELMLTKHKFQS